MPDPYRPDDEDPLTIDRRPVPTGAVIAQAQLQEAPNAAPAAPVPEVAAYAQRAPEQPAEEVAAQPQLAEVDAYARPVVEQPVIAHKRLVDNRQEEEVQRRDQARAVVQQRDEQRKADQEYAAKMRGMRQAGVEMDVDPVTGESRPRTDEQGRMLFKPAVIEPFHQDEDGTVSSLKRDVYGKTVKTPLKPVTDPASGEKMVTGPDGVTKVSLGIDEPYLEKKDMTEAGKVAGYAKSQVTDLKAQAKALKDRQKSLTDEIALNSSGKEQTAEQKVAIAAAQTELGKLHGILKPIQDQHDALLPQADALEADYRQKQGVVVQRAQADYASRHPDSPIAKALRGEPIVPQATAGDHPVVDEIAKQKTVPESGDFMRGLKVSLLQIAPLAKGTIALLGATAEKAVGEGGAATAVKQWGLKGYADGMAKTEVIAHENDDVTKAWEKAKNGDIGALVDWAQYGAGYLIGQAGETAAISLLAGIAGGAVTAETGPGAAIGAGAGLVTGAVAKSAVKTGIRGMVQKLVTNTAAKLAIEQASETGVKLGTKEALELAGDAALRKQAGAQLARNTAIELNSFMQEAGGIYPEAVEQAKKEGQTDLSGTGLAKAWATSVLAGKLESWGDKLGLDVAFGHNRMAKILGGGGRLATSLRTAVGLGTAEMSTELAQTFLERLGAGQSLTDPEAKSDYINSGLLGLFGGVALGGPGAYLHHDKTAAGREAVAKQWNADYKNELGFRAITAEQAPLAGAAVSLATDPALGDKLKAKSEEIATQQAILQDVTDPAEQAAAQAALDALRPDVQNLVDEHQERANTVRDAVHQAVGPDGGIKAHAVIKAASGMPLTAPENAALMTVRDLAGQPIATRTNGQLTLSDTAAEAFQTQTPAVAKLLEFSRATKAAASAAATTTPNANANASAQGGPIPIPPAQAQGQSAPQSQSQGANVPSAAGSAAPVAGPAGANVPAGSNAAGQGSGRNVALPPQLAGAKPKYSYGQKRFDLNFASDLDKAAYITAQSSRSKHDAAFLKHVMDATGMSEAEVRAHGAKVRDAIKAQAKDAPAGVLDIPDKGARANVPASVPSPAAAPPVSPASGTQGSPESPTKAPVAKETQSTTPQDDGKASAQPEPEVPAAQPLPDSKKAAEAKRNQPLQITPEHVTEARNLLNADANVQTLATLRQRGALVVEQPGEKRQGAAFLTDPKTGVVYIHIGELAQVLQAIEPEARAQYVADALDHELRHHITVKALTHEEIEAVGKNLSPEERTALEQLYGSSFADNFTAGAEAIAVFGQAKNDRSAEAYRLFTEKARNDLGFAATIRKWLAYARDFARGLIGKMSDRLRQSIERVEAELAKLAQPEPEVPAARETAASGIVAGGPTAPASGETPATPASSIPPGGQTTMPPPAKKGRGKQPPTKSPAAEGTSPQESAKPAAPQAENGISKAENDALDQAAEGLFASEPEDREVLNAEKAMEKLDAFDAADPETWPRNLGRGAEPIEPADPQTWKWALAKRDREFLKEVESDFTWNDAQKAWTVDQDSDLEDPASALARFNKLRADAQDVFSERQKEAKQRADDLRRQIETRGFLYASEPIVQQGIPPEKLGPFINAATALVKGFADRKQEVTPEAVARVVESKFAGKFRPYTGALWNAFRMVNPSLADVSDWDAVYVKMATTPEPKPASPLHETIRDLLVAGEAIDRRRLAELAKESGLDTKQIDEAAELGVVLAAREIAQKPGTPEEKFDAMTRLYQNQPNLTAKTSTSKINQAYSTPMPLAFIASEMAEVGKGITVFEPTAGNGALLIGANPAKVHANELDPSRAAALRQQGFQVTTENAATMKIEGEQADAVLANPPFGSVTGEDGNPVVFQLGRGGLDTKEIDHAISLNALTAMKDDGRAVLIIGGTQAVDRNERRSYYATGQRGDFFKKLYAEYGVIDHLTVDGDLYKKQGAGWPVDVIVIAGRKPSPIQLPNVQPPRILTSWDEVKAELSKSDEQRIADGQYNEQQDRGEIGASLAGIRDALAGGGRTEQPGNPPEPQREPGPGGSDERTGTDAGTTAGTDSGAEVVQPAAGEGDIVGDGSVDERERGRRRLPIARAKTDEEKPQFHKKYRPVSAGASFDIETPANLAEPQRAALEKIEQEVGKPLKEFVADKLGYAEGYDIGQHFAAEQIDALASGIYNIEHSGALILGDMAGVGKGRVVAGLIEYAKRHDLTPIFLTKGATLYSAMLGDFSNIGRTVTPLFTNNDLALVHPATGEAVRTGNQKLLMNQIERIGKLPAGYDAIFTTYDQIGKNNDPAESKESRLAAVASGGTPMPGDRVRALQSLASRSKVLLLLDESHLGAGASVQGQRLRAMIEPQGVKAYYSSATFAKRPDAMPLYFKTNLSRAAESSEDLVTVFEKGGAVMQQVASRMLAEDGQYIRRERTFDGVPFETRINVETEERDRKLANEYTRGLRGLLDMSNRAKAATRSMNEILARLGKKLSVPTINLESAEFASQIHNFVSQYLFAIKAEAAAQQAIQAIQKGHATKDGTVKRHKVIVAVQNTMEGPISELAAAGQPLEFSSLLLKTLEGLRRIKTGGSERAGTATYIYIKRNAPNEFEKSTQEDLIQQLLKIEIRPDAQGNPTQVGTVNPEVAQEIFRRLVNQVFVETENEIKQLDLGGMPLSPIDHIRQRAEAAGIRTGEITGRGQGIDKDGKVYSRDTEDISKRGQLATLSQFNNSDLDLMVINASGSTGISAHASEDFKRRDPRMMIVAQPHLDINEFVQTLGRIFRSGQVENPRYMLLQTALPAEKRPAAILGKKMTLLNANTTSNTDSEVSQGAKTVDIFNEYGDGVVWRFLADSPSFTRDLQYAKIVTNKGVLRPLADITEDMQEDGKFARTVASYAGLLPVEEQDVFWEDVSNRYNAQIAALDQIGENKLKASADDLGAETVSKAVFTPGNPGGTSAFDAPSYLETVNVKPKTPPMEPGEVQKQATAAADTKAGQSKDYKAAAQDFTAQYLATRKEKALGNWSEQEPKERARLAAQQNEVWGQLQRLGNLVQIQTAGGIRIGAITGVELDPEAPLTPSKQIFTVANNTLKRVFKFPASQMAERVKDIDPTTFEEQYQATREDKAQRMVITGNLVAASAKLNGQGAVTVFTRSDGSVENGIILPGNFNPNAKATLGVRDASHAQQLLSDGKELTADEGKVKISLDQNGQPILTVPASQSGGGKHWRDPILNAAMTSGQFVQRGASMVGRIRDLGAVLTRMNAVGVNFLYESDPTPQSPSQSSAGNGTTAARPGDIVTVQGFHGNWTVRSVRGGSVEVEIEGGGHTETVDASRIQTPPAGLAASEPNQNFKGAEESDTSTRTTNDDLRTQGTIPQESAATGSTNETAESQRFHSRRADSFPGRDANQRSAIAQRVGRVVAEQSSAWQRNSVAARERRAGEEKGVAWLDTRSLQIVHDTGALIDAAAAVEVAGGSAERYARLVLSEEDAHWRSTVASGGSVGKYDGGMQRRIWAATTPEIRAAFHDNYQADSAVHAGEEVSRMLYQLFHDGEITEQAVPWAYPQSALIDALNRWDLPPWLVSHLSAMETAARPAALGLAASEPSEPATAKPLGFDVIEAAVRDLAPIERKVFRMKRAGKTDAEIMAETKLNEKGVENAYRIAVGRLDRAYQMVTGVQGQFAKALLEPKGQQTVGRPDGANVANPATGEKSRRMVDAARADYEPGVQKRQTLRDEADRRIAQDESGEYRRLVEAANAGEIFDPQDMMTAKKLVAKNALRAVKAGNQERIYQHAVLLRAYDMVGTAAARTLGLRVDETLSPAERAAERLAAAILTPPQKLRDKIEKAKTQAERDAHLKDWTRQMKRLKQRLKDIGLDLDHMTDEEIVKFLKDKTRAINALKSIADAKLDKWDALYEFWIASILSAPATNVANVAGNTASTLWEFTAQRLAEATLNLFVGDPNLPTFTEMKYLWAGFLPGLADGANRFLKSWRTELSVFDAEVLGKDHSDFEKAGGRRAIPGKAGRIIRTPLRLLTAADDFGKSLSARMQVGAEAYRLGKSKGLEGPALSAFMQSEMRVDPDAPTESWRNAASVAKTLAFQDELGRFGQGIINTRNALPGARYFLPFVKTIANIFRIGVRKSPLGTLNGLYRLGKGAVDLKFNGEWSYTRKEMITHLAEQALAWSIFFALRGLVEPPEGDDLPTMTGTIPIKGGSRGQRDLAYRTAPPMSVRIGDTWYSYARIEPFATALGVMVDGLNEIKAAKNGGDYANATGRLINHLTAQMGDKTFARGIGDLLNAIEDGSSALDWAGNFATSWVPNLIRAGAKEADDSIREQKVWGRGEDFRDRTLDRLAYKALPIAANAPPPKVDLWGREIEKDKAISPATDWLYRMFFPARRQPTDQALPVDLTITRWNNSHPDEIFAPQPPLPQWEITTGPKDAREHKTISMTDGEFNRMLQMSGRMALARVNAAGLNIDHPTREDLQKISDALATAHKQAKEKLWEERVTGAK